jgi:hypothetical protein
MSQQLPARIPDNDPSGEVSTAGNSAPCATELAPGEQYYHKVSRLLDDAFARKAIPELASALAHGLAVVAIRCGPEATGDFLGKIGERLRFFAEVRRSQQEASELVLNGIKPH